MNDEERKWLNEQMQAYFDANPQARDGVDAATRRMEAKAEQIRRELGDAEIERRTKERQQRTGDYFSTLRLWRKERAIAHAQLTTLPPHPFHDPRGYADWREMQLAVRYQQLGQPRGEPHRNGH